MTKLPVPTDARIIRVPSAPFRIYPGCPNLLPLAAVPPRYKKKLPRDFNGGFWSRPKMEFYDLHLGSAVWYARHALAVDENRKDFARVQWGGRGNSGPKRPEAYPDWLQQIWFSGNHSDIGGSYPENESRLSDIALSWMVHAAVNLPDADSPTGNGIKVDTRSYLKLNPDPLGPQHDAREPGYLRGRNFTGKNAFFWLRNAVLKQ